MTGWSEHDLDALLPHLANIPARIGELLPRIARAAAEKSRDIAQLQERAYAEYLTLWRQFFSSSPTPDRSTPDKSVAYQFSRNAWQEIPYFNYLRRLYQLNRQFMTELLLLLDLESKEKEQLAFTLHQWLEASSPDNFFATNPEAIQRALSTQGESLTSGMANLRRDLARGRMRMCDESAFQLGRNLAITRGAVIHENPLIQLIQYQVRTSQVYATPLLIVPPFINKYYILDLRPENSFVRYALDQGFQVFILSWRNIPPELGHLTWNDYVTMGVEESIEIVQQITSARHIHTLGFCVGGTLLASALASTVPAEKIASLTLLASLLDFQEVGEIGVYIDEHFVRRSEERYAQGGVVAGAQLAAAFASLRARELIWKFVVENYLKGNTPPPFDLLYWNSDSANLPGRLYIWYLRHLYLNNSMRTPNTLRIKEQFVDLSRLRMPAFVLGTEQDHIVPWRAAYSSAQLLRGRVEFVLGASGHIAGVVSPPGGAKRHFRTSTASIDSRADEWLEKSTLQTGSWWPHWRNWLALHDEKKKRSRKTLGHGKFKAIEPAPGSYVRAGGISSI